MSFFNSFIEDWVLFPATFRDEVERRISSLGDLPDGWDYGQGFAPGAAVRDLANALYRYSWALGFNSKTVEVMPTTEGGLILSFSKGEEFLDITINDDLTLDTKRETGIGSEYSIDEEVLDVPLKDALTQLRLFAQKHQVCDWSGLSISTSILGRNKGLAQIVSGTSMEEFPYSTQSAQITTLLTGFASTSPGSTTPRLATPSASGS